MNHATILLAPILVFSSTMLFASEPTERASSNDIFEQRILPIFRSPEPSSCIQCHLASVDLKDYILPSSKATFISLRDQGLIDLDAPAKSKILTLIRMGESDSDEKAKRIHKRMRRAELDAFSTWIESCCEDESLRTAKSSDAIARPEHSDEIIRHARKSRVVDSFVRNVWSQRMRCFPCHTPYEIDPDNPQHKNALKQQAKFASEYDKETVRRMQFFRKTPEATLARFLDDSKNAPKGHLPLINLEKPEQSLLLLKPTAKLPRRNEDKSFEPPSYQVPVTHMGGLKMHKHDQSYKSILTWIEDYRRVTQGQYTSINQLPADNWFPTKNIVRVKNIPERFETGMVFQLFIYHSENRFTPVAFTQGTVTPRRIVNGALFLLGSDKQDADSPPSPLANGKYVVQVLADTKREVENDPAALLGYDDMISEVEWEANWKEGFKFAEVIELP